MGDRTGHRKIRTYNPKSSPSIALLKSYNPKSRSVKLKIVSFQANIYRTDQAMRVTVHVGCQIGEMSEGF